MEPGEEYQHDNKIYNFTIHDPREHLSITVNRRPRSAGTDYAGLEFVDLDPAAAADIGCIIGAYYGHGKE